MFNQFNPFDLEERKKIDRKIISFLKSVKEPQTVARIAYRLDSSSYLEQDSSGWASWKNLVASEMKILWLEKRVFRDRKNKRWGAYYYWV
jgi:hypothetical protein